MRNAILATVLVMALVFGCLGQTNPGLSGQTNGTINNIANNVAGVINGYTLLEEKRYGANDSSVISDYDFYGIGPYVKALISESNRDFSIRTYSYSQNKGYNYTVYIIHNANAKDLESLKTAFESAGGNPYAPVVQMENVNGNSVWWVDLDRRRVDGTTWFWLSGSDIIVLGEPDKDLVQFLLPEFPAK